ncbi:glutathione S-transferase family protein [Paracoccus laeviglucosivorans]|uniref:Glutathione S-transferase n=1 Tax=Paracoccus laeviglucosivorans TaxID=1197861 RepID=A0A521FI09_9RHOB|nr:glutathione S-transferase family protein [Paracoccus laeviglucosivorans]SMO95210.1 glutathione S-transferase [Paracoccus laeviglucosivorans]
MLTLYYHPLAAYCWKPLVALYDTGTEFTPHPIDLSKPEDAALLESLWPMRQFPVLLDGATRVPESSIIVEHLDLHHPAATRMIPLDPQAALPVRLWDRFFDMNIQLVMQQIVNDALRPAERRDPQVVDAAKAKLDRAYSIAERHLSGQQDWAAGAFSLADCAALPALFYAGAIHPFDAHPAMTAYFDRLVARPSCARVLAEARPCFDLFPFRDGIAARFRS